MVICASHLEISDFGEPVCGHFFFWSKLTRSRPQFFKRSGKMEIQGTPDQDMVSLVECSPWFIKQGQKSGRPREYKKNRNFVKNFENFTCERY